MFTMGEPTNKITTIHGTKIHTRYQLCYSTKTTLSTHSRHNIPTRPTTAMANELYQKQ